MNILPLSIAPAPPPTFWEQILAFLIEFGWKTLAVVGIVVGAFVLSWVLRLVIRRIVSRIVVGAKSRAEVLDTRAMEHSPLAQVRIVQRTRTLGSILQNIVNVAIVVIALILIVYTINADVIGSFTLLTAAIGAGLGFGAQNIVQATSSTASSSSPRTRSASATWSTWGSRPASSSTSVSGSRTCATSTARSGTCATARSCASATCRWAGRASSSTSRSRRMRRIDEVEEAMLATATGLPEEAKWRTRILEKPEIWGLESVSGDALVIRLVMKTRAGAKDDVARELRMRLKNAIDELGLTLPQLNSITLSGLEGAQRVRGANPPKTKPTADDARRPDGSPRGRDRSPSGRH